MGGFLPITLAGRVYNLRDLPRGANRAFQRKLKEDVYARVENVGPLETADKIMDAMADAADLWLDLLVAYDLAGAEAWSEVNGVEVKPALPDRDWLDARATDAECYRALKKVTGEAVYPLAPDIIKVLPELVPMLMNGISKGAAAATVAMMMSTTTSSSPPSTDGSPTKSSAA